MPTYEYHCTNCLHQEEIFQKITESPLEDCPGCGKKAFQRGPGGGIGLAFKGTGYYITDYGSKPASADKPSQKTDKPPSCCPCGKNQDKCMF
ncbi:MAG TPA: FmdB family zinc ribbon protein [Waddliaceae bacterium]